MRISLVFALTVVACGGGRTRSATMPVSVLEQRAALLAPALQADVAVRHRRRLGVLSWKDIVTVVSDDDTSSGTPPVATATAPPDSTPEQLVVEVWLQLQIDDVPRAVGAIDARVAAIGGRVVSSSVEGSSSAALVLRVPPAQAPELASWLDDLGVVESRRTLATDVSRDVFDRELELGNLRVAMHRLEQLASKELPLAELLDVEKEMTRVRGEIERVEGEQRFVADRVEFATINLTLTHEGGPVELAHARVYPGARLASLVLLDPGMRATTRLGGGASLRVSRYLTFDVELFPRDNGDSRAVLASLGTALYSDYFGGGRRRFGNPFLGGRVGYGYLSGRSGVLFAAELGVELYRHPMLLVEAEARAFAIAVDPTTEAGFEGLLGVSLPF